MRSDDADEKERKYEGIDVMRTPAEIGKNAPAPMSQKATRASRALKLAVRLLIGPASAARVTKAQATRRATAWCPALNPLRRSQRSAPMYVPTAGAAASVSADRTKAQ
eukprot:CAMPEP_0180809888 /NCGR_PEP_ID=MMETSP1038_2-20121128/64568_1 /TAXON_ID=632150 /ORGANISM="Azadinium spinosum, Strain 3D9" /LENGTH=107 /DNA_ID=CAMNT_0022851095 /DNA_START=162 /DNA_END=485 /DNA_ORIENTATION=-